MSSRSVIERNLPGVAWVESSVTWDKLCCVHDADELATIGEHARRGGFRHDAVSEVRTTISPETGR